MFRLSSSLCSHMLFHLFKSKYVHANVKRHSCEGSDSCQPRHYQNHLNFNPRSHEGSDVIENLSNCGFYEISIHAPTREATATQTRRLNSHSISIHAPTRGATTISCAFGASAIFQSTLPRGERQQYYTKLSLIRT